MKDLFKLLIVVCALFVVCGLTPAHAQLGNPSTVINAAAINGTASTTATASVANASTIGLQLRTVSGAANTSNTTVTVSESIDGTYYVDKYTWTVANTGTTAVNATTNLTAGGMSLWKFTAANGAVDGVTNTVTIKLNKKSGL
jgi:hypothetical protein